MIYKFFIISFHAPHEFSQNLNWVTDSVVLQRREASKFEKKVKVVRQGVNQQFLSADNVFQ